MISSLDQENMKIRKYFFRKLQKLWFFSLNCSKIIKKSLFFIIFGIFSFLNQTLGLRKSFLNQTTYVLKNRLYQQSFLNRDSFLNRAFLNRDSTVLFRPDILIENKFVLLHCAIGVSSANPRVEKYFGPVVVSGFRCIEWRSRARCWCHWGPPKISPWCLVGHLACHSPVAATLSLESLPCPGW